MKKYIYKHLTIPEVATIALDKKVQLYFKNTIGDNADKWMQGILEQIDFNGHYPYQACIGIITRWYEMAAIRGEVSVPDSPSLEVLKKIKDILGSGWIAQDGDGTVWHYVNKPKLYDGIGIWSDRHGEELYISHLRGVEAYTKDSKNSLLNIDETIELLEE